MAGAAGKKAEASSPATVEGVARAAVNVPPAAATESRGPAAEAGKASRPIDATAGIALMIGGGAVELGLAVYWLLFGGNLFAGLLFLVIGGVYAYGGRALYAGESWGWGAGVFTGGFAILFGLLLLPLGAVPIALAAIILALLLRARAYYGMVRADPEEEERKARELQAARTQNPEGRHCPNCGSTALWIAADGSAVCESCKKGTISLGPSA